MKKEWKELFTVRRLDNWCNATGDFALGFETYEDAVEFGKKKHIRFMIDKYFVQVDVPTVYEYRVVFRRPTGGFRRV